MLSLRALAAIISLGLLNLELVTCRSPGESGKGAAPAPAQEQRELVTLPGVATDSLTAREKADWSEYVSELLAPCPDQPVNLATCVREKRDCKLCLPAAQFLADQVREGKARSQIEGAYRKRFAPDQVKKLDLADSPAKGPENAPVVIVEWADFECPFCAQAADVLHQLYAAYPDQIRLVFKHYPLPVHKNADKAARAAVAAHKQGKFWEMNERLFELHGEGKELDETTIAKLAQELKLDLKKFKEDATSEATADTVARDRKQADKLELSGTPWIYVNGRHFDVSQFDLSKDLEAWVRLEIEAKTGTAPVRTAAARAAGDGGAAADAGAARGVQTPGPARPGKPD